MELFINDGSRFYEQECVQVGEQLFGMGPTCATLLDLQAGKALVLLFEEFREAGTNGLLELEPKEIFKLYD
jgi:hypothetical protein